MDLRKAVREVRTVTSHLPVTVRMRDYLYLVDRLHSLVVRLLDCATEGRSSVWGLLESVTGKFSSLGWWVLLYQRTTSGTTALRHSEPLAITKLPDSLPLQPVYHFTFPIFHLFFTYSPPLYPWLAFHRRAVINYSSLRTPSTHLPLQPSSSPPPTSARDLLHQSAPTTNSITTPRRSSRSVIRENIATRYDDGDGGGDKASNWWGCVWVASPRSASLQRMATRRIVFSCLARSPLSRYGILRRRRRRKRERDNLSPFGGQEVYWHVGHGRLTMTTRL